MFKLCFAAAFSTFLTTHGLSCAWVFSGDLGETKDNIPNQVFEIVTARADNIEGLYRNRPPKMKDFEELYRTNTLKQISKLKLLDEGLTLSSVANIAVSLEYDLTLRVVAAKILSELGPLPADVVKLLSQEYVNLIQVIARNLESGVLFLESTVSNDQPETRPLIFQEITKKIGPNVHLMLSLANVLTSQLNDNDFLLASIQSLIKQSIASLQESKKANETIILFVERLLKFLTQWDIPATKFLLLEFIDSEYGYSYNNNKLRNTHLWSSFIVAVAEGSVASGRVLVEMERYYQTTLGTNTKLAAMTTDYMQRVILKGSFKHQMKMLIRAIRAIRLSQGALDPVYEALEKIKFDAQRIPFSRFDFFNLEIHIQALFADSKQNKLDPKLEALLLDIFQLSIDHLEKIYHTPPRADLHPENTLALHDAQELTTCLVIEMMKASYNDPDKFRDLAFKLSQVPYMDQRIGTASRTFSARLREGHGLYFDPFNRY